MKTWKSFKFSLLLQENLVTSVSWVQMINNPQVWYSHNILSMKNMTNRNIIQRGTQTTGLCVMISICSLDIQHEGPRRHPLNVGCSFSSYTKNHLSNFSHQRLQRRKWTRKTINLHFKAISEATPHKVGIEKEW